MADVSSEQQQQYMASNTTSASPGPSPTTTSAAAASASPDPKNVQDLTNYVQLILQQMQDKFQEMSDKITGRNILFIFKQHLMQTLLKLRSFILGSFIGCSTT